MEFDWDAGNISHIIDDHDVWPEEAEQAIYDALDHVPVIIGKQKYDGEERIRVVGSSEDGRILTVVFTKRNDKIRVVTAFDSGRADIRQYEGRRGPLA